jgi:hypothetical protein
MRKSAKSRRLLIMKPGSHEISLGFWVPNQIFDFTLSEMAMIDINAGRLLRA